MSEVRIANPSVRRVRSQIEGFPRDVETHKEARKQRQWDHTVDAIQQFAVGDDRVAIVEYQVADSHATGLDHSGRFRRLAYSNQVEFGTARKARFDRSRLVQDDELRATIQEKAEAWSAVDPDFEEQPCWG
jgi:hypothetical protein